MTDPLAAALTVARHFDEDAFACDFGGQTAVNLPNLEVVIPVNLAAPVDRARIAAEVQALKGECHDWEGLGCKSDPCVENVSRSAVLRIIAADAPPSEDAEFGGSLASVQSGMTAPLLDETGPDLVFSTSPAPEGIDTDCMFLASPGRMSVHVSRRAINAAIAREYAALEADHE